MLAEHGGEEIRMRVDAKISIGTPTTAPRRAASSSFTVDDAPEARATASAGAAAGIGSIDALLVLQGEEDPAQRRRRSARHGRSVLDALDGLKAALLAGRISGSELLRLRTLLRQRPGASDDPGLEEVLAHIELRAEVELAKLGR
jgi:hypothetical protein